MKEEMVTITVWVPKSDLEAAMKYTGKGIEETVQIALREYANNIPR